MFYSKHKNRAWISPAQNMSDADVWARCDEVIKVRQAFQPLTPVHDSIM